MVTQASVSLIDNQGNIKQTLKDLGSKQSVRQLGFAIASAGIGSKINKSLGLSNTDITQAGFNDRLIKGIADGTSRGLLESAVYGVDLEEALKQSLTKELVGLGTQNIFKDIIHDIDGDTLARNIAHKLAAGLTSHLSAKAHDKSCEAGSIGAVVGEMWGDYQVDDPNTLTQAQKNKLINQAKMIAGITAAYAGEDVNVAAGVAAEAVRWNGAYQNKVRSIASLRREFSDNDKLLVSKIESGEIPFNKNVADYLFLINTDENLVLHVKFKEPIRVKLTRANEPWKNNKSVPGEEIHSATTMARNAEWAVLGNVTLSRPIGTEEYRIIPDEYDFDIKSWREYPIRNTATILGRPGNGKKFKIIPVGKVILGK